MTFVRLILVVIILLEAGACTTQTGRMPADRDIDFVRGCWVQKEAPGGKVEAFVRLLPDGDMLSGQLADVATGDWISVAVFAFARSGESVTFEARDMPDQPTHTRIDPARLAGFEWGRARHGGKLAAFAGPAPSRSFLFAEGGADRLAIWAVTAETDATLVFTLFDGERDGCD